MRGGSRAAIGLLALIGLLAACTDAFAPTLTPVPPPSPPANTLILPAHFRFETLGYRLHLDYPAGWQVDRWAQTAALYLPGEASLPQVGIRLFYHYAVPADQMLDVSRLVRWRPLWQPQLDEWHRLSSDGLRGEALDPPPGATQFEWGGYPAAYFAYRYQDDLLGGPVSKYQLAILLPEEDTYLVLWAAVPDAELAEMEPILRAMLASLVLNDAPLPVEPVLAAAVQGSLLQATPTPVSGGAPRDSWVGATP